MPPGSARRRPATTVTVKSTDDTDGSLHRREELEGPADRTADVSSWPASAARSLILELCGDAPLVELVTIRQFRRRRDLALPTGEAAVELSLDEVDVVAHGRVVERFLELELELTRGSIADLAPLQALLDGHHGLTPSRGSKLERGLLAARRPTSRRPPAATRPVATPRSQATVAPGPPAAVAEVPVAEAPVAEAPEPVAAAAEPVAEAVAEAVSEPAVEAVVPPDADPEAVAGDDEDADLDEELEAPAAVDEDAAPATEPDAGEGRRPEDGPVEGKVIDLEALEDAPELIDEASGSESVEAIVMETPAGVEMVGEIPVGKTPGVTAEDLHAEAGRKVLRFHLARMIAREAGTREGEDPEELHAMRVATRRMRAAWRVFGDGFRTDRTAKFRRRLRTVAARLGAVRDLDVLIEATEAFAATLPGGDGRWPRAAARELARAARHRSPARCCRSSTRAGTGGSSRTTATSC